MILDLTYDEMINRRDELLAKAQSSKLSNGEVNKLNNINETLRAKYSFSQSDAPRRINQDSKGLYVDQGITVGVSNESNNVPKVINGVTTVQKNVNGVSYTVNEDGSFVKSFQNKPAGTTEQRNGYTYTYDDQGGFITTAVPSQVSKRNAFDINLNNRINAGESLKVKDLSSDGKTLFTGYSDKTIDANLNTISAVSAINTQEQQKRKVGGAAFQMALDYSNTKSKEAKIVKSQYQALSPVGLDSTRQLNAAVTLGVQGVYNFAPQAIYSFAKTSKGMLVDFPLQLAKADYALYVEGDVKKGINDNPFVQTGKYAYEFVTDAGTRNSVFINYILNPGKAAGDAAAFWVAPELAGAALELVGKAAKAGAKGVGKVGSAILDSEMMTDKSAAVFRNERSSKAGQRQSPISNTQKSKMARQQYYNPKVTQTSNTFLERSGRANAYTNLIRLGDRGNAQVDMTRKSPRGENQITHKVSVDVNRLDRSIQSIDFQTTIGKGQSRTKSQGLGKKPTAPQNAPNGIDISTVKLGSNEAILIANKAQYQISNRNVNRSPRPQQQPEFNNPSSSNQVSDLITSKESTNTARVTNERPLSKRDAAFKLTMRRYAESRSKRRSFDNPAPIDSFFDQPVQETKVQQQKPVYDFEAMGKSAGLDTKLSDSQKANLNSQLADTYYYADKPQVKANLKGQSNIFDDLVPTESKSIVSRPKNQLARTATMEELALAVRKKGSKAVSGSPFSQNNMFKDSFGGQETSQPAYIDAESTVVSSAVIKPATATLPQPMYARAFALSTMQTQVQQTKTQTIQSSLLQTKQATANLLATKQLTDIKTKGGLIYGQKVALAQDQALTQKQQLKQDTALDQVHRSKTRNIFELASRTVQSPSRPNRPVPNPFQEPKPQPDNPNPVRPKIFRDIGTPKGSPFAMTPSKPESKSRLSNGFNVFVRREGKFKQVNKEPLSRSSAIGFGSFVVGNTAAATFKIGEAIGEATRSSTPSAGLQDFYQKGDMFIERKQRRIKSAGEKQEITRKGIFAAKYINKNKNKNNGAFKWV